MSTIYVYDPEKVSDELLKKLCATLPGEFLQLSAEEIEALAYINPIPLPQAPPPRPEPSVIACRAGCVYDTGAGRWVSFEATCDALHMTASGEVVWSNGKAFPCP